jgi:iron complex outermembrane recepter protein
LSEATLIVAHQKQQLFAKSDADYSSATIIPLTVNQASKYWTGEARLAQNGDSFKWIAGVFALSETAADTIAADIFLVPGLPFPAFSSNQFSRVKSTSYAAFGQATYSISPSFDVTAGIRYSNDKKRADNIVDLAVFGAPSQTVTSFDADFDAITGRIALDWKAGPDTIVYGSVSKGYKAGGFSAGQPPYNPEDVVSFEIGTKHKFFGGKARIALDAFYYDYKDLQLTFFDVVNGAPNVVTRNAGSSRIYGVEFEGAAQLAPWIRIDGTATYLNARIRRATVVDPGNEALGPQNLAGFPLPRSPDFTLRGGIQLDLDAGSIGRFEPRMDVFWSDSYSLRPWNVAVLDRQNSYTQTNLSIRWITPDDHFALELTARNLENTAVKQFSGANRLVNSREATYGDPRTVMVTAYVNF